MTALRDEAFVDATNIASVTGLTYGVNRPGKHASNPIYAGQSHLYDHHQVYGTAVPDGQGGLILYNTVFADDWTRARVAKYTAGADGLAWSRPNLGLFTVDGNTNNSVVLDTTSTKVFGHGFYDPINSPSYPWLIVGPDAESYPYLPTLWGSSNGTNFSVLKRLDAVQTNKEPWSIVRRSDGRWIVYYQSFPSSVRSVGAWLSDTTSLTGSWTDQGNIMVSTDSLNQYYSFAAWRQGDVLFAMRNIFNGANQVSASASGLDDRQFKMELLTSRASDGLSSWTLLDSHWVEAGNTIGSDVLTDDGSPDWGCIKIGGPPVQVGNEDWYFYSQSKERHHPYPNSTAGFLYQHTIGVFKLTASRIGQLGGTGNCILSSITAPNSGTMRINCTGTVKVELLDASNNVITGYSQANCDTLPADAKGEVVTWAGSAALPTQAFKTKIYVTSGTVHRLRVDPPAVALGSSANWSQSGIAVSVTGAPRGSSTSVQATVTSELGGRVRFGGADAAKFDMSLDNSSWASTVTVPAGSTTVYLRATPGSTDTALSAYLGVPL